jgi:cytochrome c-type biogenesis protein CcmH
MTLWLILALMTGAAIFAVIWPLAKNGKGDRSGSDIVVYRDQLEELDVTATGSIGKPKGSGALKSRGGCLPQPSGQSGTTTIVPTAVWHRRAIALAALSAAGAGGAFICACSLNLRLNADGPAQRSAR